MELEAGRAETRQDQVSDSFFFMSEMCGYHQYHIAGMFRVQKISRLECTCLYYVNVLDFEDAL